MTSIAESDPFAQLREQNPTFLLRPAIVPAEMLYEHEIRSGTVVSSNLDAKKNIKKYWKTCWKNTTFWRRFFDRTFLFFSIFDDFLASKLELTTVPDRISCSYDTSADSITGAQQKCTYLGWFCSRSWEKTLLNRALGSRLRHTVIVELEGTVSANVSGALDDAAHIHQNKSCSQISWILKHTGPLVSSCEF